MGQGNVVGQAHIHKLLHNLGALLPVQPARAPARVVVHTQQASLAGNAGQVIQVGGVVAVPDVNSAKVDALLLENRHLVVANLCHGCGVGGDGHARLVAGHCRSAEDYVVCRRHAFFRGSNFDDAGLNPRSFYAHLYLPDEHPGQFLRRDAADGPWNVQPYPSASDDVHL